MEIGNSGIELSEVTDILSNIIENVESAYADDHKLDAKEIGEIATQFIGACAEAAGQGDETNESLAGSLGNVHSLMSILVRFLPGTHV